MEQKLAFNQILDESLREMIQAAEYCIDFDKRKHLEWKDAIFPGCLGFPASIILFSIADAIGSYFEKNELNNKDDQSFTVRNGKLVAKKLEVTIDGSPREIGKDDKHFYIFNSPYYKSQNFSENEMVKILYGVYRNNLIHNLGLPSYHLIEFGEDEDRFFRTKMHNGEKYHVLYIKPFFDLTKFAVDEFRKDLAEILEKSKWKNNISRKNIYLQDTPPDINQGTWDDKDSPPPASGGFIKFPDSF